MASKDKKPIRSKNFFDSFKHAFAGIWHGIKTARNLQFDLCFFILVIICGFIFQISITEWLAVLICSALVMSLELVNSAIEDAVNLAMPDIHPLAKASKDVAAGAVLLAAIMSVVIGLIIFIPKIISLF